MIVRAAIGNPHGLATKRGSDSSYSTVFGAVVDGVPQAVSGIWLNISPINQLDSRMGRGNMLCWAAVTAGIIMHLGGDFDGDGIGLMDAIGQAIRFEFIDRPYHVLSPNDTRLAHLELGLTQSITRERRNLLQGLLTEMRSGNPVGVVYSHGYETTGHGILAIGYFNIGGIYHIVSNDSMFGVQRIQTVDEFSSWRDPRDPRSQPIPWESNRIIIDN